MIPPDEDARFVWKMEDVLSVYKRPYDEKRPVVCMDEAPRQLIEEVRRPLPPTRRKEARYDYHYKRKGVVNLFMFFEPLGGWREVIVRSQRKKEDWAACMKTLLDRHYPEAEKVVLVMDNLNTHNPSSFYEAFDPEEAKRLTDRLEIHYTPEHGSWLNMAEIELSVLARQCLSRRIGSRRALEREIAAWKEPRNADEASVEWRFTTEDARIKLKRLYPSIYV